LSLSMAPASVDVDSINEDPRQFIGLDPPEKVGMNNTPFLGGEHSTTRTRLTRRGKDKI